MTREEKRLYLKENGWWALYHEDCWFNSSEDTQHIDSEGKMVGFRPKEEGITLEEAYKKLNQNKDE